MTEQDRIEHAKRRIHILEEDGAMFGLVPHEEAELATCRAFVAQPQSLSPKKESDNG